MPTSVERTATSRHEIPNDAKRVANILTLPHSAHDHRAAILGVMKASAMRGQNVLTLGAHMRDREEKQPKPLEHGRHSVEVVTASLQLTCTLVKRLF
jgi:hypothetical protein